MKGSIFSDLQVFGKTMAIQPLLISRLPTSRGSGPDLEGVFRPGARTTQPGSRPERSKA